MVLQDLNIYDELAELLASMDSDKVLRFHASKPAQQRLEILLEKNKADELTPLEAQELEKYMAVEHIVRLAKARARQRLAAAA